MRAPLINDQLGAESKPHPWFSGRSWLLSEWDRVHVTAATERVSRYGRSTATGEREPTTAIVPWRPPPRPL